MGEILTSVELGLIANSLYRAGHRFNDIGEFSCAAEMWDLEHDADRTWNNHTTWISLIVQIEEWG